MLVPLQLSREPAWASKYSGYTDLFNREALMKRALEFLWALLLWELVELVNLIPFLLVIAILVAGAFSLGYYRDRTVVTQTQFIDIHSKARVYYIDTGPDE